MKEVTLYKEMLILTRGIGQVMFQNHALSGLLMLVGIFLNSWQLGLMAVCGNLVSTQTARMVGCKQLDIQNGLYGFNGTLVGIAVGVFLHWSLVSWLLLVVFSCLTVPMVRMFSCQQTFPGFTAPFILSVWLLLGICAVFLPHLLLSTVPGAASAHGIRFMEAFALGFGQVMFQANLWTGLCFWIAIWVNSRTDAWYAAWGALLPLPLALLVGMDAGAVNLGLMGYNGVLCALAFSGQAGKRFLWATVSVVLSVVLQVAGQYGGIPTLTAPFVLSVWTALILQKRLTLK